MGRATELEVVHMPFGKYKGTALRSIPKDYLVWFTKNAERCENIKRSMRIVLAEWGWQDGKASKGKPKRKKRRQPPVDGYAAAQQRASIPSDTIEECPFDVPETELDAEYREIMGVG
jgi:uncharacterized protein (DUF3820 family)